MERTKQVLSAVLRGIGLLGILLTVALYVPLTVPRLLGLNIYAITSGSMAPEIPVGSAVYARAAEPAELQAGDIIVFRSSLETQGTITHRVVSNDTVKGEVTTKGDANGTADLRPVAYANIAGKVQWKVPMLGWLAQTFETSSGKLLSMGMLLASAVIYLLGGSLSRKEAKEPAGEPEKTEETE